MGILDMSTKQMSKVSHHVGVLKPGVVSVFESDGNTKRYFGMLDFHGDKFCRLNSKQSMICFSLNLYYQSAVFQ